MLALARARADTLAGQPIACGLTNNVDLVVSLTTETLAALLRGRTVALGGPRQTRAETPDELLTGIVQCLAAGQGIDLPVTAAVQGWLMERVTGRRQLGGTGAQAAQTLARFGFPAFAHLTGCSVDQAALFDRPELVRVLLTNGGIGPVSAAATDRDETMWHVALEYGAGLSATVGGDTITAPAGNRVIVSHDPVNAAVTIDPRWVDAVADPALGVRRVLLSGYSQVTERAALRRLIAQTVAATHRWRVRRPELTVHVELGAMPDPRDLAEVAESLGPEVASVGLNADELRDLIGVWGIRQPDCPRCLGEALGAVRRRIGLSRIVLHTGAYAMTLTDGDPETERDALLFGALVASTRARTGSFPTLSDLAATVETLEPHPEGVKMVADLGAPDGLAGGSGERLVVVPAPLVAHPAAAVGLGDSFTAGLLAMR